MKKQKDLFKKIFFLIFLGVSLFCFYGINEKNYLKKKEIQENTVKHPENLPRSDSAKITSFGFKNLRADMYRLQTIQYIGGNAISSKYKKYLYKITDLINELNPFFEHPYVIAQLLLPDYNYRYEDLTNKEKQLYINQAEKVGLKGIKNFCDKDKLELIRGEYNLKNLWTEKKYENPCKSYKVPFYLAFIYYFYKNDPIESAFYYKVASANKDTIQGAKILSAIMQGKGGDREKSIFMFLALAKSVIDEKDKDDISCAKLASEIEKIKVINSGVVKQINKSLELAFGEFDDNFEKNILDSNTCKNYLLKASREINLYYLDEANKLYFKKNGKNAKTSKDLKDGGFIDYEPTDFQQYKDYGIVYIFNKKTGFFDYEMGDK